MPAAPPLRTVPPFRRAAGEVRLPGSKSISNRALLLAASCEGTTALRGLLDADDTRVMIAALRELGVAVVERGEEVVVTGCGGRFPSRSARLHLGNAGTAMRPLTAALAFAGGRYLLDGVPRMRERPIGDLVDALRALGARIRYLGAEGHPPLEIEPAAPLERGEVEVAGGVSSQFVSSLLLSAPGLAPSGGLRIHVPGPLISEPYVTLTTAMMGTFGVTVARRGRTFHVPRAPFRSPGIYRVEGDASAASYFLALGALAGGPVRVLGVGAASLQGDVAFARLLESFGARVGWGEDWIEAGGGGPLRAVELDCTPIPDAAMTAAVVAAFAEGRSVLRGIGSWRVKETDRIAAMADALRALGARVEEGPDWLAVTGPAAWREATIDPRDDHRVAMCGALAAAAGVAVHLQDPGCVAKTFPGYLDQLEALILG